MKLIRFVALRPRTCPRSQLVYVMLSHVAIASHMLVVKEYGGVTAVLVGSTRKAMTIALSFINFHPEVRAVCDVRQMLLLWLTMIIIIQSLQNCNASVSPQVCASCAL